MHLTLLIFVAVITVTSAEGIDDVAFIKLGSFVNARGRVKSYYIPRYFKSQWTGARAVCKSYDMDFVSLDTAHEADYFLAVCRRNANLFTDWTHVGGIALQGKNASSWYWVTTRQRVNYTLKWAPKQPDNHENSEYCLTIGKFNANDFLFNDIYCDSHSSQFPEFKFVCQAFDENLSCSNEDSNP